MPSDLDACFDPEINTRKLAAQIQAHWRARGARTVRVEVYLDDAGLWAIKSNLVGGLPPQSEKLK